MNRGQPARSFLASAGVAGMAMVAGMVVAVVVGEPEVARGGQVPPVPQAGE